MKGQGEGTEKHIVLFPKIVFLYDENMHGPGKEHRDLFELACRCSLKAMYPDFLSLTGEGYVSNMYKQYGKVVSPMGCRAFLSPWFDENGELQYIGRANIGVVSLHLPMIYQEAKEKGKDFYENLSYYMQLIREIHISTYKYLGKKKASTNPLGFMEGGFIGGNLKADDCIAPVIKSWTASFGITALNELSVLATGKSITESPEFALEVMKFINEKVNEYKKEDGHLYAIYGTPAESLCGLQIKQFREEYGIIEGVSSREYVSNSFHCGVWEEINPFEKQDKESLFWDLFNGGKIQYTRYPNDRNLDAVITIVERGMKKGFYQGVNLELDSCNSCGHRGTTFGETCPKCGSDDIHSIRRMNGYLGVIKSKYGNRFNKSKSVEINERKSM